MDYKNLAKQMHASYQAWLANALGCSVEQLPERMRLLAAEGGLRLATLQNEADFAMWSNVECMVGTASHALMAELRLLGQKAGY